MTEIDTLTRRRQAIWAGAKPSDQDEVARIATRLAQLYAAKRHDAIERPTRDVVMRRARIETELERLAAPPRVVP